MEAQGRPPGLAPRRTWPPSPHALSRNSPRGQGGLARCQRAPSALGPPGPAVPARLPKLTLAGPAHTPPFWALRSPPRRAMLAPNTPEPWADCGMGSTSGQSLGKRFPVPAPARAHPCLQPCRAPLGPASPTPNPQPPTSNPSPPTCHPWPSPLSPATPAGSLPLQAWALRASGLRPLQYLLLGLGLGFDSCSSKSWSFPEATGSTPATRKLLSFFGSQR